MDSLESIISRSQERRIKKGILTGSHVIVNRNGKKLLDKTFGFSSAGGEKLESDAVYRIASMTKPVTAAALLIEHERGRLNIYDDLSSYIESFDGMLVECAGKSPVRAENGIKLYMLVSHISGINSAAVEGTANPMPFDIRTPETVSEYASGVPLVFEPGTSQAYNTSGFDVAARVIELTSGMEFSEYLKKNIFDRLGMNDTCFEPSEDQWRRMVAVHDVRDGRAVNLPDDKKSVIDGYPVTYHAAGCALISTACDYAKFAEMLLNCGKAPDGSSVMSEESVKLMASPVVGDEIMPGSQKWGLGVRVICDGSYVLPAGSFGWSGKFGSHFWVDPVNGISAVYMKNSAYDGGAGCQSGNEFERDVMKYIGRCRR